MTKLALGPLEGQNLDVVERMLPDFLSIILSTWNLGPFFGRFITENLLIATFKPQFLPQTCWLPIWISEPKFKKKHCATIQFTKSVFMNKEKNPLRKFSKCFWKTNIFSNYIRFWKTESTNNKSSTRFSLIVFSP